MKNRRVGTFTLGISMIALGVAWMVSLFTDAFTVYEVVRFWPVFIILFGIEVLIHAILNKEEKLRYDGLSIFLGVVLILAAFAMAGFDFVFRYLQQYYPYVL